VDHLEWKFQDFCAQEWQDYFVIAIDQEGKSYFAAKEVGPDLAAAIAQGIITRQNALAVVERMLFTLEKAKEVATKYQLNG
jgi:hypothetical protein